MSLSRSISGGPSGRRSAGRRPDDGRRDHARDRHGRPRRRRVVCRRVCLDRPGRAGDSAVPVSLLLCSLFFSHVFPLSFALPVVSAPIDITRRYCVISLCQSGDTVCAPRDLLAKQVRWPEGCRQRCCESSSLVFGQTAPIRAQSDLRAAVSGLPRRSAAGHFFHQMRAQLLEFALAPVGHAGETPLKAQGPGHQTVVVLMPLRSGASTFLYRLRSWAQELASAAEFFVQMDDAHP